MTALCVAGVTLGGGDVLFARQAWHLVTPTCVLRGRRGACGPGLGLVARLVAVSGAWRHRRSVCVAGVVLGHTHLQNAWHLWHWAGSGGAFSHTCARNISVVFPTWSIALHTQHFHTHTACHTTLSHTTLSHTTLSQTTLSHTTLSQTTLSHTRFHTHLSNTSHKFFWTYRSSTTSFVFPLFPILLQILFLIIGRSWLVGLFLEFFDQCPHQAPLPNAWVCNREKINWEVESQSGRRYMIIYIYIQYTWYKIWTSSTFHVLTIPTHVGSILGDRRPGCNGHESCSLSGQGGWG